MILAGTTDGYEEERKVVIDWKSCEQKPSKISPSHEYQALLYAFALIAKGYEVDFLRIVYIQRRTTKLPARTFVFDKEITDEMLFDTVKTIELMKKSINTVKQHPELENVIFRPNPMAAY